MLLFPSSNIIWRVNYDSSLIEKLICQIKTIYKASPNLAQADLVLRLKKTSQEVDPQLLKIALDSFLARQMASDKLGSWATQGYFSLSLLEQASRRIISDYRARFFSGLSHILEIGTGTGSDTAALAKVANRVTTIEVDPIRAEMARHNLALQGISNVEFLVGDSMSILSTLDLSCYDGFFADPARRSMDNVRVRSGDDYSPRLSTIMEFPIGKVRAIKISPGLFFTPPYLEWKRQFVGIGNECLEQTLWYGASIVDSSVYLADVNRGWAPNKKDTSLPIDSISINSGYLIEAHAAINRCQYLTQFFAERGIARLEADIAYGWTSELPVSDSLMERFEILSGFNYSPDRLSNTLKSLGWTTRTEVKKRNFQGDVEKIHADLRLPPHSHNAPYGTIFLFKWLGNNYTLLTRRILE